MKQLFLTSSAHAVAHDIAKKINLSKGNRLVFINTAAEVETGGKAWLRNDRKALVAAGFEVTDYTITGKNEKQLKADLSGFDFVYLSGGNTFYLLEQSQKSGFISVIKDFILQQGKTYIGTSAGSIIAGKRCPDYLLEENEAYELENRNGYGFVNFIVLPHWGSPDFKKKYLGGRLAIAYQENVAPLVILTDTQYIHVLDDQFRIIEVKT
jgi:dipeptidase E